MPIYLIIMYYCRNRNPYNNYICYLYKIYRFLCITATVNLYCNLYNAKKMADFKTPGLGILFIFTPTAHNGEVTEGQR